MNISRELIISLAIKAGAKLDCGTVCFNGKDIDDFPMRFAELLTLQGVNKCKIPIQITSTDTEKSFKQVLHLKKFKTGFLL